MSQNDLLNLIDQDPGNAVYVGPAASRKCTNYPGVHNDRYSCVHRVPLVCAIIYVKGSPTYLQTLNASSRNENSTRWTARIDQLFDSVLV
jgi:hypothetical protein